MLGWLLCVGALMLSGLYFCFALEMGEGAWGGGLHRRIPIGDPAPGGGAGPLILVRICVGAGSLCVLLLL